MVMSIFATKNQKLVKKWEKEHVHIVKLAMKLIEQYNNGNKSEAKKTLKKLTDLVIDHVMDEDLVFYRMLKKEKCLDVNTKIMVNDFTASFKSTKILLMNFLYDYANSPRELDDNFFKVFNDIVGAVAKRIEFEEKNLYTLMNKC